MIRSSIIVNSANDLISAYGILAEMDGIEVVKIKNKLTTEL